VFLNRKHTRKLNTKNGKKIFFKTQPQPQKNKKREIVTPFLQSSKNSNRKHPIRLLVLAIAALALFLANRVRNEDSPG
jgi:hypothetical protein